MIEVWKLHDYGCINLEAKCPENSARRCIVPVHGKVKLPLDEDTLQCTCCGHFLKENHVVSVFANNCAYAYKGLLNKKDEAKSENGVAEVEVVELHGLALSKWKQVAVASVVNEDSYRECKLCQERWADRIEGGKFIVGHYFCVACTPKVVKRMREKEEAAVSSNDHFNYLTDWSAPTGTIKTKGGEEVDIQSVSLSSGVKQDAEKARLARLEQLKNQRDRGVDVAEKFSAMPVPFQKPRQGEPGYVSSDSDDFEEGEEVGGANLPAGEQGMKRGGKRGGPTARGGPKPRGGPYKRGQGGPNSGGDPNKGSGYKSMAELDEELRKKQPVVTLDDIAKTELKATPTYHKPVVQEDEPSFVSVQLKATPRNDAKPAPNTNDSSAGISVQLRATPKTHRLSASVQKREEPTFLSVQLKATPRRENDGQ